MHTTDLEKRTLTITRTFQAPHKLVWEAWTSPDHIAHWWGPGNMETSIVKHDFRVGGDWKYTMDVPGKGTFESFGTWSRIEPMTLVETTANFIPMTQGVTILANFSEVEDGTQLVFKVIHPTEEYCSQQRDMGFFNGWGSVFDGLVKHLENAMKSSA